MAFSLVAAAACSREVRKDATPPIAPDAVASAVREAAREDPAAGLELSPAEQIALRGFQVNVQFAHVAEHRLDCLAADAEAARIFLRKGEDGEYEPKQPGDKLIQPDLARTLHAIGERGPDAFYKGRVARSIVDSLASRGGIVSLDDLARVQVRERRPLESTYRGHRIVTMPLPSSGGFIVSALLNVLEREQPRAGGYRPERFLHAMIETEKRLYAVRQRLGDPAFNPGSTPRIQVIGNAIETNMNRLEQSANAYISDGNPAVVAKPTGSPTTTAKK